MQTIVFYSVEEDLVINDKLSVDILQVADTDLCLNKISHLAHTFKLYTVNEIKITMVEHAVNVLNVSDSLSNQDNHNCTNLLNSENVPIRNEQILENVETQLENATIRFQVTIKLSRLIGR
ncbi:uncharacterized protein LOC112604393 [Melanaphis sacchari]|uniref:uncharacterized protein LOC112604393 n=1 Tax=Melanaphis sacchari TaxID=742174 RepID=UPI000DC1457C|nr:uncharacterized protein LOC112604393 [Melanaphis sacchari]